MNKSNSVVVTLAEEEREKSEALAFINKKYLKKFGTTPQASHLVFVARCGGQIVGTIGLDYCDKDGLLYLEKIHQFDHRSAPFPVIRNKVAQFGRWISDVPDISSALLYAATVCAKHQGKIYGWCEHTDVVHKIASRFNIVFYPVPGTKLILENVPDADRAFYEKAPQPKLYITFLPQVQEALEQRVLPLIESGKLVIEPP